MFSDTDTDSAVYSDTDTDSAVYSDTDTDKSCSEGKENHVLVAEDSAVYLIHTWIYVHVKCLPACL